VLLIIIIKFGSEDIINILTKILNSKYQAIEESIRTVQFNKSLPEYQNIKIKNLRSNMALVHDRENFNAKNQYNTVYELIDNTIIRGDENKYIRKDSRKMR
jgi:hypothetical protein